MCGPRQPFFFQCGLEMPKGWTPLVGSSVCKCRRTLLEMSLHTWPLLSFPSHFLSGPTKAAATQVASLPLILASLHTRSLCTGLGAPVSRQWEGVSWAAGSVVEGTVHAKAGRWEKASHLNSSTIYPKGRMNTLVQKPELQSLKL